MDSHAFFLMLEGSRLHAGGAGWAAMVGLLARLSALGDEELLGFRDCLLTLHEALGRELEDGERCQAVIWQGPAAVQRALDAPREVLDSDPVEVVPIPIEDEMRRRGIWDRVAAERPSAGPWAERRAAEHRLLQGDLPREWRKHADPYVRALAWLAHPPQAHAELFSEPERLSLYLAARARPDQTQPGLFSAPAPAPRAALPDLEPLTLLLWLELWGQWPESYVVERSFDRRLLMEGLLGELERVPATELAAARLRARPPDPQLHRGDPLCLAKILLSGWGVPDHHLDHPDTPAVLRFLLGWLEKQERETTFAQELLRMVVEVGTRRGLLLPADPEEEALLQAILRAPAETEARLVYADWCAQRERAPRPVELLRELRRVYTIEALPDRLEVACALARLGDASGLELLQEELMEAEASIERLIEPLWALGDAAAPLLPVLRERAPDEVDLAALCVRLRPTDHDAALLLMRLLTEQLGELEEDSLDRGREALALARRNFTQAPPSDTFAVELQRCERLLRPAPG